MLLEPGIFFDSDDGVSSSVSELFCFSSVSELESDEVDDEHILQLLLCASSWSSGEETVWVLSDDDEAPWSLELLVLLLVTLGCTFMELSQFSSSRALAAVFSHAVSIIL